jgi:hypothetical protein
MCCVPGDEIDEPRAGEHVHDDPKADVVYDDSLLVVVLNDWVIPNHPIIP